MWWGRRNLIMYVLGHQRTFVYEKLKANSPKTSDMISENRLQLRVRHNCTSSFTAALRCHAKVQNQCFWLDLFMSFGTSAVWESRKLAGTHKSIDQIDFTCMVRMSERKRRKNEAKCLDHDTIMGPPKWIIEWRGHLSWKLVHFVQFPKRNQP